jgi:putative oxidoreductase
MREVTGETRLIIPFLRPLYAAFHDLSYAVVRFVAGAFLVPHGLWKVFGITGSQEAMLQFYQAIGLEPAEPLMYATGITEIIGGVCVALGFLTRPAALATAITTGTAALYFHIWNGFYVDDGGVEFAGLWTLVLLMIAVWGGGRLSIDRLIGREF